MGASWSGCEQPRRVVNGVVSTGASDATALRCPARDEPPGVPPLYAVPEMKRLRSTIRFLDRYVTLAGKNCCSGRSWTMLNRSLERRTKNSS
jgi:hypothetical protein